MRSAFLGKAEITLKTAIRRKASFSLRVAREQISLFAYGFANKFCQNAFKMYASYVVFSYGIFG